MAVAEGKFLAPVRKPGASQNAGGRSSLPPRPHQAPCSARTCCAQPPRLSPSWSGDPVSVSLPGYPEPEVTWYKDDVELDRYCGLPKYEITRQGNCHSLQLYR